MSTINWADLQKVADEASRPLPIGQYPTEVEKAESTNSSNDNPMIKLELRVWDGPGTGRKLFTQLTLSKDNPNALAFFFRNLGAFGVDASVLAGQPSMEDIAAMLIGRKVTADVNIRPYQGVDRNNVKGFAPAAPGVVQPIVQAPLGGGGVAAGLISSVTMTPVAPINNVAPIGTPVVGVSPGPISVVPTVAESSAAVLTPAAPPGADKAAIPSF